MSELFNGTTGAGIWSIGACSVSGDWTIGQILKYDAGVAWQSLAGLNAANSYIATARHNGSGGKIAGYGGGGSQYSYSSVPVSSADGWALNLVRKLAGSNAPVSTLYPIGGSPTHLVQSMNGGTLGDPAGAQTSVHFGEVNGSDPFKGHLAVFGAVAAYMSTANVESLVTTMTRANWVSLFAGVWDADDSFATDRTGNGATRTSLVGTTVDAADNPAGWSLWSGGGGGGPTVKTLAALGVG